MRRPPSELSLELLPQSRVDVIDVHRQIAERHGDVLQEYPKALYCSFHTTAGYFDQRLSARLNHDVQSIQAYVQAFQHLFPPGANYEHDKLHLRTELTEEQRRVEPRNADSHLTFIGSGLENCVTYENAPDAPVFFVDLDGINGPVHRRRRSTVVGYHDEAVVQKTELTIPVSTHRIDSVNLRDLRLGLFEQLQEEVDRLGLTNGWIELSLSPDEHHAGLTMNEYETLLMRHDLPEVLRNPMRYVAEKGRNMLRDPRAIPGKAKDYAKYDLVHFVNEVVDALGLSESLIERIIDKFLAVPASRFLSMKRQVRLLVSTSEQDGRGQITHGRYQSPILVQWKKADDRTRRLSATFVRFV